MSNNYRDREVTLPISEELAGRFFEGRGRTSNLEHARGKALVLADDMEFDNDLLLYIEGKVNTDVEASFVANRDLISSFRFLPGANMIYMVGSIAGEDPLDSVVIAGVYGKWDDSGPRLIMKWMTNQPTKKEQAALKSFVKHTRDFDEYLTDADDIDTRMEKAVKTLKELEAAKEALEARLPENVVKHILAPMIRGKKDPAAALAPLLKKGGARRTRRRTRRNH